MYISQQRIDNILEYLEMLKEKIADNDIILSINEIKKDLTENAFDNKVAILDELIRIRNFTNSLREQMQILSYSPNVMKMDVSNFTYAMVDNLQYIVNQLYDLINEIEGFSMQKK